jgi:hypothetical protein
LTYEAAIAVDIYLWSNNEIMVGGVENHVHVDILYDVDNPFIDAYLGSIKKARDVITGQCSECT